jgi:hypothetical protein
MLELHNDQMVVCHQNTPFGHCVRNPVAISITLASILRKTRIRRSP